MTSPTAMSMEQMEKSSRWVARCQDYVELTKPRILMMVLVAVTLAALSATWGQPDAFRLINCLVGTTLVAASASVFNQWLERDTDARMRRTERRPLPTKRVGGVESLFLGGVTVLGGLAYLLNTCGPAAATWAAATWLLYVGVYTPLKTRTWLNTLVGAIPGAMPVLIGWSAAGGPLDARAWSMFLILFLWQFPHFMAIAWLYRAQYGLAGMQMLTVVDPTGHRAGRQALLTAVSLLLVSVLPAVFVPMSWTYLLGSLLLGGWHLRRAVEFQRQRDDRSARDLLRASIIYLPIQLLLVTLLNVRLI